MLVTLTHTVDYGFENKAKELIPILYIIGIKLECLIAKHAVSGKTKTEVV